MKHYLPKIFVSLAIGIIIAVIAGNINRKIKYNALIQGKKTEIPKELYDAKNAFNFPVESTFNQANAITFGLSGFSALMIIFFLPSIIRRKDEASR